SRRLKPEHFPRSPVRPEGDVGARLNEAFEQYSRLIAEGRAGHRSQIIRYREILGLQLQRHQQHRNLLHLLQQNCSVFTPQGQYLLPQRQLNFGRSIISIDYHNVLDKHKISNKKVLYPVDGDHPIRQENRLAIQRLEDLGLAVIVTSFIHTDWRKRAVVASCATLPIDRIIITQTGDGTGWGGKLDVLRILCPPSEETSLIHVDDKASIWSEPRNARGQYFGTCHIKYPGKPACPGVRVHKNLSQAVDQIIEEDPVNQVIPGGNGPDPGSSHVSEGYAVALPVPCEELYVPPGDLIIPLQAAAEVGGLQRSAVPAEHPDDLPFSAGIRPGDPEEKLRAVTTPCLPESNMTDDELAKVGIVMLILPFGYLHLAQALWQNIAAAAA
ncbi:unnamed protein product, partial [Cladocopium goreaui]